MRRIVVVLTREQFQKLELNLEPHERFCDGEMINSNLLFISERPMIEIVLAQEIK
jgi:hypothetical protein